MCMCYVPSLPFHLLFLVRHSLSLLSSVPSFSAPSLFLFPLSVPPPTLCPSSQTKYEHYMVLFLSLCVCACVFECVSVCLCVLHHKPATARRLLSRCSHTVYMTRKHNVRQCVCVSMRAYMCAYYNMILDYMLLNAFQPPIDPHCSRIKPLPPRAPIPRSAPGV
jgi:hypothetical protein